jgi:hypothetical protein
MYYCWHTQPETGKPREPATNSVHVGKKRGLLNDESGLTSWRRQKEEIIELRITFGNNLDKIEAE